MSGLDVWLAILGLTLATLVTRAAPLYMGAEWRLPPRVESALRYAPACALAAIIMPDLLLIDGALDLSIHNTRMLAGAIAAGIFLLTRGTLSTIAGGMVAYWLLEWLIG